MKGLLYREFYLARKFYLTNIGAAVLFTALCYLVQLSLRVGNLAHGGVDVRDALDPVLYVIAMYMIPFLFMNTMLDNGVNMSDYKCRWNLFSRCLPVTPVRRVAVKFIVKFSVVFAALAICTVHCAIYSRISGFQPFDMETFLNLFLILDMIALSDLISAPLYLGARTRKQYILAQMSPMIPVLAASFLLSFKVASLIQMNDEELIIRFFNDLRMQFLHFSPLILVCAEALNFGLCCLMSKRREA